MGVERSGEVSEMGAKVRFSRREGGQALAETAIGLVIVIMLLMGIIEFGRAFMISNAVANAARVGARAAAIEMDRDASGFISSHTQIVNAVRTELQQTVGPSLANSLSVVVSQPTAGVPLARVTITGQVPYIFNLVGTSFQLNRSVSYRDQGR